MIKSTSNKKKMKQGKQNVPDPPKADFFNERLNKPDIKANLLPVSFDQQSLGVVDSPCLTNSWFSVSCMSNNNVQDHRFDSTYTPKAKAKSSGKNRFCDANTIFRSRKYLLNLSKNFKHIIKQNMAVNRFIYNKCVRLCFRVPKEQRAVPKLKTLRQLLVNQTTNILSKSERKFCSSAPNAVIDECVRDFIKNYDTLVKLKKEGKIKKFNMKFKSRKRSLQQSIVINAREFKKNRNGNFYCFPKIWNKEIFQTFNEPLPETIPSASRLIMTCDNKFYLAVPVPVEIKQKVKVFNAVSLDPGVRTFQSTYDTNGWSYQIGSTDDRKMDELAKQAQRMRDGHKRVYTNYNSETKDKSKKVFIKVETKKEKKGLMKAALRLERKISNHVDEIHKKTAKFLCDSYDTVIIPKFESGKMSQKVNNGKRRRINKTTSRRMLRWSHYKFKTFLKEKGQITSTNIVEGTEEWTSKTCANCSWVDMKLGGNKVYSCKKCFYRADRDISAARNIMVLNWDNAQLSKI